ncbi:MAG: hypothetical protein KAI43_10525 [Candidatus Aureabacteria bacterium]|nr:hypothetical protein [Candidatus Auribacterota bacterium]
MTIPLIKNIDNPNSKYLVFTSAGDNANIHFWLKGHRKFDLWVSYYGNEENRYKDVSDFYIAKKGGKFPALHYVYQHWGEILNHYEAIFIMDDDLIINGSNISRLFEIREEYDLWILQPAFSPIGRISFSITRVKPFSFLRYTNFIEVGCALFRRDKLDEFMKIYDPTLVAFGIEWWYSDVLIPDIEDKAAIVDKISCINPGNWLKGGQREIDLLDDHSTRVKSFRKIKKKYNIQSVTHGPLAFDSVKAPLSFSEIIRAINIYSIRAVFGFARIIRNLFRYFTRQRH